ncbi:hypothetical protein C7212DRAFT_338834, partial [Tuber magnatum]
MIRKQQQWVVSPTKPFHEPLSATIGSAALFIYGLSVLSLTSHERVMFDDVPGCCPASRNP